MNIGEHSREATTTYLESSEGMMMLEQLACGLWQETLEHVDPEWHL